MNNKEYQTMIGGIFNSILKVTEKKGHDYASDDDTLKNFKVVAKILGTLYGRYVSPEDVAMFFIVVKLARLVNLKGKEPQCESVQDTILDMINYIGLYQACKQEKTK